MNQDIANQKFYERQWLQVPFRIHWENSFPLIVTLTGIGVLAGVLLLTNGNIRAAIAALVPFALILLTCYRLDYSLMLLLGMVLFFDQDLDLRLMPYGFHPFTVFAHYFDNLNAIPYLPDNPIVMNPVELHLILLLFVWFFVAIRKNIKLQNIPVWPAFLLFLLCFGLSLINGLRTGGEFLVALWEVRALVYLSILYIIVPQIIQTRRQLRIIIWICILVILFKACQGFYRYASLGFTTGGIQTFTNHEDPVFITTLFIFLATMLFLGCRDRQRTILLLLTIPFLLGFYVSFRRAAIAGLFVSFAALFLLLGREERKQYLKLAVPGVIFLLIYGAAFWNSDNRVAAPVQMVKSGLVTPVYEENPRDYYSNLYRDYENYNLAVTIQREPVTGIGFGNMYDMPLELAEIQYALRDYIPHNQIIWLMVKTGAIGFFAFWLFFNAFVFKGASVYARIKDPWLKAVCAMVVLAVINQMVVSYFDLQLTFYRNMIYLGVLMGMLPTIERLGTEKSPPAGKD
jgi:hypothetical protein